MLSPAPIEGSISGWIKFLGIRMLQNGNALPAFNHFFQELEYRHEVPARILELGTAEGGLSIFLKLYAETIGAEFKTYDLHDHRMYNSLFEKLDIDFRLVDLFSPTSREAISTEIAGTGITVLLCDNGDKRREFNIFSAALKIGDFILAHDYCLNAEMYQKLIHQRIWSWFEIQESDIREECRTHGLENFMYPEFQNAAWVCKRKGAMQTPSVLPINSFAE